MSLNLNLNKFWKKRSVTITEYDPTYKVTYLGNVLTAWAKGDGCVDKPLSTLWRSYCQSLKPDVSMKVTVCTSGLKATTKEHGLTEYWSNRITYCCSHPQYPKVFCWVYRHEGRKLKQELRCHAVLCSREETGRQMATQLRLKLSQALYEFRKEKICRQNARLSLANCVYDNPSLPRRKILLSTGTVNYRPPIDRCRSAPRLGAIEESQEETSLDHSPSLPSSSSTGSYGKGHYGAMKAATAAFASRRLTVPLSSASASNLSGLRCNGNIQGTNMMMNMRNGGRRFAADNGLSYLCHRQKRQYTVNDLDSIVVDVVVEEDEEVDLEEEEDDEEEEEEEEATSDIVTDEDNVSDRFASYEDQDPDADSVEESPAGRTERLTSIDENAEDDDGDDNDDDEVEDDEDDDLDRGVVVMVDNRNGLTDLGNMQDTLMVGACRADEDNVSDESGYSEENDRDFNCKM